MSSRRIAFVPPRYGSDVVGGAELLLAEVAHGFAARGWQVEVLTTCARDHFTWENVYPAGVEQDGDVTVRRFPVARDTSGEWRHHVETQLQQGLTPSLVEQERWLNDSLRVPDLYHHLLDHAEDYHALIPAPYMFWTTFACAQVAPERTILTPCLHDEPYARLEVYEPMFTGVAGVWFLTEPEAALADGVVVGPRTAVVGAGIDPPARYDAEGFRARHGVTGPFVMAGGRREGAKGWETFLDAYTRAVRNGLDLQLVTFGVGDVRAEPDVADRIVDLGFLSAQDLTDAYAAADAYVQPSVMESFSRTVMESWLAGTLVIANAGSAVVDWHCTRSGAGLVYRDAFELEQCLRFVAEAPSQARALAAPGRAYVLDHYTWPVTLDRMEATLEEWL